MAQLVVPTGTFVGSRMAQLVGITNRLWSHGSVGSPMWLEHQTVRWHGSVGRALRSHRRGRWFESNCHHHSQALVDQGLASFLPYSHVRDLSLLTACSTNEAMRRWHGFVAWRYGFFARKSQGSVAVLESERSDATYQFIRSLGAGF